LLSKGFSDSLKNPDHNSDLLLIGHLDLREASQDYIAHRKTQGMTVLPIDLKQIYTEFSQGRVSSKALKDFILYTVNNWDSRPRYVLILGDATYDPKNVLNQTLETDLIPMPMISGLNSDFGSLSWFVTPKGESKSELPIGWIPSSHTSDIYSYFQKVIDYENGISSPDIDKVKHATFIAGKDELNENFASKLSLLAKTLTSAHNQYSSDLLDQATSISNAEAKIQVTNAFAEGPLFLTYYGHGAENMWGRNIFTNNDASLLSNSKLPIVLALNCLNAKFYDSKTNLKSFGEKIIFNSEGGGIVFLGSTTMTAPTTQMNLATSFYNYLADSTSKGIQDIRLGDIMFKAKSSQPEDLMSKDTVQSFALIGDPSLRFPVKSFSSSTTKNAKPSAPVKNIGGGCSAFAGEKDKSPYGPWGVWGFLFEILIYIGAAWSLKRIIKCP